VLTTGTFMRGLMHTGEQRTAGGRVGEGAAGGMSAALGRLGFELGRLKTGTPPRLARESIDWDGLEPQRGDENPIPFSDMSPQVLPGGRFPVIEQVECRITATCPEAHDLIRANLHRAPMHTGQIEAECGPRYCPSIEDKVVRFAQRDSHHVFLEPESLDTNEIYCNGISTSLPTDVQEKLVHLMPGCQGAKILRWGYAVEYDMVWPHQIDATCMTKSIEGLFLAGQINCTTGYEEAAAQGLLAGVNAARIATDQAPVRLGRDQSYIGVMMDDLVTKTPREPYRMFTSRAEHRLLLRPDNADQRLTPLGRELGTVCSTRWQAYERRSAQLDTIRTAFGQVLVEGKTLRQIARRPETTVAALRSHLPDHHEQALIERVAIEALYEGYIVHQRAEIKRQATTERRSIPDWLNYSAVSGLRAEAAEVLSRFRPATMGQAARVAGVNPSDLTLIAVAIKQGPGAQATLTARSPL
ncbi:MAG: tRNA uridine-5-carboxymethylaminomethyl(34) synthesis enzyme MnmG, partial [Deltaproteobacteria bacterium]|nr:tRNA uridine-5-carboxymethylaminomethyl(34) synthesis enzyme MnmG [Deltaproteobacteria bacterium]